MFCNSGIVGLAVGLMCLHKQIELMLTPVVEAPLGLRLRQFIVEVFHESLIRRLPLILHVDFELYVLDLLGVGVELEGRELPHTLELSPLSFLVLVVPALNELIILCMRIDAYVDILLLLEQTYALPLLQLLLESLPDLTLFLFVLLHTQA